MSSFATSARRPSDPAVTVFDITPNDSADLPQAITVLNVATPGTVRVTVVDGSTADLTLCPGAAFPVQARRVWQTGTTATGIRGLV